MLTNIRRYCTTHGLNPEVYVVITGCDTVTKKTVLFYPNLGAQCWYDCVDPSKPPIWPDPESAKGQLTQHVALYPYFDNTVTNIQMVRASGDAVTPFVMSTEEEVRTVRAEYVAQLQQ